ncbi:MAG TPA: adenosylcobinamide-GDP ribazoletransferase [Chloroflexota bacterium]|nr:adenosylcobinamide-GDP ribazoletransferase [Chloroflexota bacterium]
MSGLWSAVAFLTRFPTPAVDVRLDAAVPWFPLVGLLLGGILALADIALRQLQVEPLVTSAVLVTLLLALTGALHADGLIDTCDAVFGHASPERRLEIMRDPRTGAFGVVGLVCVVLLKVASIEALPPATRSVSLILAPALGRWAIVVLACVFPYGRASGLGLPLKKGATRTALGLASIVPLGVCAVAWPSGPWLGVLALALALLVGRWLMSLLPGLTGDCYGAVCEVVETAVWLAAAPLVRALGT